MDAEVVGDLEEEPVDLPTIKAHLRLDADDTTEDTWLTDTISEARMICEGYSGLSFGAKTIVLTYDEYAEGFLKLPFGPVDAITTVEIDQEEAVLDSDYTLAGTKIKLYGSDRNLAITYTTKATEDQSYAPLYRSAIKAQVAFMYAHRGDEIVSHICDAAQTILTPIKVLNVF
jgi:hypothetical protein